jgi:hypothetical protein
MRLSVRAAMLFVSLTVSGLLAGLLGPAADAATTFSVTISAKSSNIVLPAGFHFSGQVSPSRAGATVYLQRYYSGSWHDVANKSLSSTSTYAFAWYPNGAGHFKFRVRKPTSGSVAGSHSAAMSVTARRWRYLSGMDTVDGYTYTGSLRINGASYNKSLYWHDGSAGPGDTEYAEFDLRRGCKTFDAHAGLDDDSTSDAQSEMTMSSLGTALWDNTFGVGQAQHVNMNVSTLLRIRLEYTVSAGDGWNTQAYPAFGDARVLCAW